MVIKARERRLDKGKQKKGGIGKNSIDKENILKDSKNAKLEYSILFSFSNR